MNLGKMKTLVLAILLLMNLFFFIALSVRTRAASTYESGLIDAATASYEDGGLYVDRHFLQGKIPSFSVYTGTADTVSRIGGMLSDLGFSAESESGGTRFAGGNEAFFFGDDFSFSYFYGDEQEKPSELFATGLYPIQSYYTVSNTLSKTVFDFLDSYRLLVAAEKAGYTFEVVMCYGSGADHVVCVAEKLYGMEVGMLYFRILGERLISADGVLALVPPARKMSADQAGPMQILFAEKNRLDAEYRKSGNAERERKVLSAMNYSYAAYFDTDGSFYFVPILSLIYEDGSESHYNYVNGKEYIM